MNPTLRNSITREEARKMFPFFQAFVNGETIEAKAVGVPTDLWEPMEDFCISPFIEWRIKPKPLELWVCRCIANNTPNWKVSDTQMEKECPHCEIILMREVQHSEQKENHVM